MKTILDLVASFSFVIGWLVVIAGVGYLIPSLMIGPGFALIALSIILIGGLLLWVSRKL